MSIKKLPFDKQFIESLAANYPTPFYLYDEKSILENIKKLQAAFSWNNGFKEYFAVKATPNPFLMKIFHQHGLGMDCSSYAELVLCERLGIKGEDIIFTSNDTPAYEYKKALELGAIINLDDITHIEFLEKELKLPELIFCRYNPGPLREGNAIIGKPEEAKYGFTREQLFQGYKMLKEKGVKRFGLHTMVASNELNEAYFVETANMLVDLVVELNKELGIKFEAINMGGGIGIPYLPEKNPVNIQLISDGVRKVFENKLAPKGLLPLRLNMECGGYITGPYGYLITKAIHEKKTYRNYVGVDACMANLMRPGMYGAYHHITVLGKEEKPTSEKYDVVGSLCENNDKFAIDRMLPAVDKGDILVIHDSGAHGHSMGFNYNGKPRCAELLWRGNGSIEQIRRAETVEDLFSTLDFNQLNEF